MADQYRRQIIRHWQYASYHKCVLQGTVIILVGPSDSGICTARIFGADHQTMLWPSLFSFMNGVWNIYIRSKIINSSLTIPLNSSSVLLDWQFNVDRTQVKVISTRFVETNLAEIKVKKSFMNFNFTCEAIFSCINGLYSLKTY